MAPIHRTSDAKKTITLTLSDDRLKLFATVEPGPDAAQLSEEELLQELSMLAPVELLDRAVILDILRCAQKGEASGERRIAKGRAPIDGKDGKIVWLVRRYQASPDKKEGDEPFSDFFHLGLFENVRKGQEIARVYKPKPGTPGIDAVGKSIGARPGRPLQLKLDKTVAMQSAVRSSDYEILISGVDGYVREEASRLTVLEVLEIPGNVDYSIGHVDFIGAVNVKGDLHKGFNIKARGAVTIQGSVLGQNTIASGASVTVRGFHQGGDGSGVYARDGFSTRVAHHVKAEVHGPITVEKEALECQFRTTEYLHIPQGQLQGGCVWSVKGVEVKALGNEAGFATQVEFHAAGEISEEYENLQSQIARHKKAILTLELHLGPYTKLRARIACLREPLKTKIVELTQKYDRLVSSLKVLTKQAKGLGGSMGIAQDARVNVLEHLYPGVTCVAGDAVFRIKEEVHGPLSLRLKKETQEWSKETYETLIEKEGK